jgi:hypothetical protein
MRVRPSFLDDIRRPHAALQPRHARPPLDGLGKDVDIYLQRAISAEMARHSTLEAEAARSPGIFGSLALPQGATHQMISSDAEFPSFAGSASLHLPSLHYLEGRNT